MTKTKNSVSQEKEKAMVENENNDGEGKTFQDTVKEDETVDVPASEAPFIGSPGGTIDSEGKPVLGKEDEPKDTQENMLLGPGDEQLLDPPQSIKKEEIANEDPIASTELDQYTVMLNLLTAFFKEVTGFQAGDLTAYDRKDGVVAEQVQAFLLNRGAIDTNLIARP